ncbi:MAG: hypothetical protein QM755_19835 [Luteolibacter sp.]
MKVRAYALLVPVAVIAGLGGFLAGRQTGGAVSKEDASVPPLRSDRSPGSSSRSGRAEPGDGVADSSGRRARGPSLAKLGREQLQGKMSALMRSADAQERARAWLDFVDGLEPGQFEQVVADFRSMGLSSSNLSEYATLLSSWAKHDPLAALDFAEKNTGSVFARQAILSTWANTDPAAALAWANSHFQGAPDQGNPWLVGVIRGIAANDPVEASRLMQGMPFSRERGDALASLVPTIMAQGAQEAMAWADGLQDPSLKDRAMREIAPRLAEQDPKGAANWLAMTNTGYSRGTLIRRRPSFSMRTGSMDRDALLSEILELATACPRTGQATQDEHSLERLLEDNAEAREVYLRIADDTVTLNDVRQSRVEQCRSCRGGSIEESGDLSFCPRPAPRRRAEIGGPLASLSRRGWPWPPLSGRFTAAPSGPRRDGMTFANRQPV